MDVGSQGEDLSVAADADEAMFATLEFIAFPLTAFIAENIFPAFTR